MSDFLYLNTIGFPVLSGQLHGERDRTSEYRWGIEINCAESPQLEFHNWADDRAEEPLDWLAGSEPYLYAQMLPVRVDLPDELVGRTYSFPQSPHDEPFDWPSGMGWPFFCLYLFEHDWAYPMSVTFSQKRGRQYRVEIAGSYPANGSVYDLRVQTWLDWQGPDA